MKITKELLNEIVRKVKKNLKEAEEQEAKPSSGSKERPSSTAASDLFKGSSDRSEFGKKSGKIGLSTLQVHLQKLMNHTSYGELKAEAAKGPEQKLQLLDVILRDLIGIPNETVKPIANQLIGLVRRSK